MNQREAALILNVSISATADEVRAAFAVQVRQNHPDTLIAQRDIAEAGGVVGGRAQVSMASLKKARDLLLERSGHKEPSAKVCPVCRGSGIQAIGLRRYPCVRGCEEG